MFEWLKRKLDKNDLEIVGWFPYAAVLSTLMVVASWVLFVAIGPNWGIDFTGGTEIHLKFEQDTSIGEVRTALRQLGLGDDSVQQVEDPEDDEFVVRIQDATFGSDELRESVESRLTARFGPDWIDHADFDAEVGARLTVFYTGATVPPAEVAAALEDLDGVTVQQGRDDNQILVQMPGLSRMIQQEIQTVMGDSEFEVLSIDAVGPKVGGELRQQGFIAVIATLGLILVYVAFRFDLAFAPGAILALFHDVSITIGIFVLLQREFNLPMIGALLTIVGYSLNDTIVIYDRIRENMERYRRQDLKELINVSVNETLGRTLATSFTTLLAISAFLFMGGEVIQNFAIAMACGILFGSYSTIYVASPFVVLMQHVTPRLQAMMAGNKKPLPEGTEEQPLTEAEKRRRERAIKDKEPSTR